MTLQQIHRELGEILRRTEDLGARFQTPKGREFADPLKEHVEHPIWALRNQIDNALRGHNPRLSEVLEQKEAK